MAISPSNLPAERPGESPPALFSDPGDLSGKVRVRGHFLHWGIYGHNHSRNLVLHHGLGSMRSWLRQTPAVVGAGLQVLGYDRWGYGRSKPRPGHTPDLLFQEVIEIVDLLDRVGNERGSILSNSDGGSNPVSPPGDGVR